MFTQPALRFFTQIKTLNSLSEEEEEEEVVVEGGWVGGGAVESKA